MGAPSVGLEPLVHYQHPHTKPSTNGVNSPVRHHAPSSSDSCSSTACTPSSLSMVRLWPQLAHSSGCHPPGVAPLPADADLHRTEGYALVDRAHRGCPAPPGWMWSLIGYLLGKPARPTASARAPHVRYGMAARPPGREKATADHPAAATHPQRCPCRGRSAILWVLCDDARRSDVSMVVVTTRAPATSPRPLDEEETWQPSTGPTICEERGSLAWTCVAPGSSRPTFPAS